LKALLSSNDNLIVYADLQDLRYNESPPETIPSSILVTPYRPDLVIYNKLSATMGILELTCPLDSEHHLESAHDRKQNKTQILAELDRLNVSHCYSTSVLGHFQPHSIKAIKDVTSFVSDQALSTATVRSFLIELQFVLQREFSLTGIVRNGQ